jgi:hypothetical protein
MQYTVHIIPNFQHYRFKMSKFSFVVRYFVKIFTLLPFLWLIFKALFNNKISINNFYSVIYIYKYGGTYTVKKVIIFPVPSRDVT